MKQEHKTKQDITELLARVHKAGSEPVLGRAQKKRMLSEILPRRSFGLRFAPLGVAMVAMCLILIGFPLVSAGKPGTALYNIKRKVEDIRSTVQPSFDNTLLKKRDDEIKTFTTQGDEKAVEKVTEEKKIIEDRIKTRTPETQSSGGSTSTGSGSSRSESESNDDEEHDDEDADSSESDSSNASSTSTITRDSCRHALDERKEAGESISSDLYKTCDSYPH